MKIKKLIITISLIFLLIIGLGIGKDIGLASREEDLRVGGGQEVIRYEKDKVEATYKLGQGNKKPKFKSKFEFLQPNIRILATSEAYLWGVGGNEIDGYGKVLYKSGDLGETWEKTYVFSKPIEGIHISPKSIIFVSISDGRWEKKPNCQIYRSSDGGEKFEKVLNLKSGAAINWNFASDEDGYVFVSEYGYKSLPDNARRIYRSKDGGRTWKIVYQPKPREAHHNHIIQIDKDNKNIIYQSIGDKYKEIIRSTDRGNTWHRLVYDYNPTSMVQIGDKILWGLDNHPRSGIIEFNKKTGKVSFSLDTPKPYNGSIYDMIYENGVLYSGLLSYSQPSHTWDGSMFISRDQGKTWENFATWPKLDEKSGIGFYNMFSKDGYGFINGQFPILRDGKPSHYNGTLRFKLVD